MRFRYLHAGYGFDRDVKHIAVPDNAEPVLKKMAGELVGSEDLVAIYVPEGTGEVYSPGNKAGRVVGAVRLMAMPKGKTVRDYFYEDSANPSVFPRWPIGWPCESVYVPPAEECPTLRSIIEDSFGPNTFGSYVKRLQRGPFKLEPKVEKSLTAWFVKFPV